MKKLYISGFAIFSLFTFSACNTSEIDISSTAQQNEPKIIVNNNNTPNSEKGRPPDKYACIIDNLGHCIFTGTPHQTILKPKTNSITDRTGNVLFSMNEAIASNANDEPLKPSGRPAFDGDKMIKSNNNSMSNDEKAFHKTMAIMFPIRNALMYDIDKTTNNDWDMLIEELTLRDIKQTTYTGGPTPKDNFYSTKGIYELAKQPNNKDIHHDIMKFLEESGLYLLCHVTSDAFNASLHESHPQGHDPCKDAKITTKIGY